MLLDERKIFVSLALVFDITVVACTYDVSDLYTLAVVVYVERWYMMQRFTGDLKRTYLKRIWNVCKIFVRSFLIFSFEYLNGGILMVARLKTLTL